MQNVCFEAVDTKHPPFKGLIVEENLSFDNLPEFERLAIWDQLYSAADARLF